MSVDTKMVEMQSELAALGRNDLAELFDEKLCITCSDCQANVHPINCKIYPYIFIDSKGPDPDGILLEDEDFEVAVVVRFSGPGARALMCLDIPLTVEWYAESIGNGPEPYLGSSTIQTKNGQFVYLLRTQITHNELKANFVYKVAATVTLGGKKGTDCPALMNGYAAGGFVQVYKP